MDFSIAKIIGVLQLKIMESVPSLISKHLQEKTGRNFIGTSSQIREVLQTAITAGSYPDVNVLITGESGTGKENIARIIHHLCQRRESNFWPVNCSAIPETLLESEFFGHKKGAFTGAISDKIGFFELSHNGTLFLDEIADMPYELQAKILRAIEEKVITRIGETSQIHTDFRVISATNHDLEKRLKKEKFRLDLYYRLNTIHIHIPPLRERKEDIKPMLLYFIQFFSRKYRKDNMDISVEAIRMLEDYPFPGNVRELRNIVERSIIFNKNNILEIDDFNINLQNDLFTQEEDTTCSNLFSLERTLICKTLKKYEFNQQKTADALGIHRDALSRKMKKYQIKITRKESKLDE
jgi:transcriptional regulator with PAS, ATPase and Fis domain